jgi:hypothetical protein
MAASTAVHWAVHLVANLAARTVETLAVMMAAGWADVTVAQSVGHSVAAMAAEKAEWMAAQLDVPMVVH